jgi:Melibiase/Beta-galactosidase jelly roll domain
MDRRTFVLLTSAASAWGFRPTARQSNRPTGRGAVGRLEFELDDRRNWSLWYRSEGRRVPVLPQTALGVRVGDQLVTLGDLEDITVGSRQPPGGESVLIRGRAAGGGVFLEADFFTGEPSATPQAAISLTIYPDRFLPTVRGVRFFQVADAIPSEQGGDLVGLINGYHSWSPCRVEVVRGRTAVQDLVSHAALGLTRDGRALGLAFDAGEPGEAKVKIGAEALEAVSEWLPARPLRPAGDTSVLRLCYAPSAEGDALAALTSLFRPASLVDRERLASLLVPAGWCSWYELFGNVTEDDVVANLEFCAASFDRRYFRLIQLDDGYQRSTGDWETNQKFPHGHRWLTDRIHAKGFRAGLWVAPFAVTDRSGVPAAHPEWLLKAVAEGGGSGPPVPIVWDTRDDWGGKVYSLDGAHPEVQAWLRELARRVVRDWGYDYLKIDFLHWATAGSEHYGGLTHAEAYRAGLAAIRDGLGSEAFLLGCGAPLQHAVGYVNGMRIGTDVDATWGGIQPPALAAALRGFYHRGAWLNDPDCLVVRPPLTDAQARTWAAIVAVSGAMNIFSDNLPKLPPERVPLLRRTIPVAPVAGRAVDVGEVERVIAPAVVVGDHVIAIPSPWKFRTGDDPAYGTRGFDEGAWEAIPVPERWERAGHADYNGFAWYRTRFQVSGAGNQKDKVFLELGKIDDVDETFVNGTKVGQTGEFPPGYRSDWTAYRRYAVPADVVNWGGENVLAVRVYDGGGSGGLWSVRRDRPPRLWMVEGASRWWTIIAVNWDDNPLDLALPLGPLGITGAKFAAYDVWADKPLADVGETLSTRVDPRSSLTVALRPALARPQVIGTTRHVVQGAIDMAEERWDAAARTLYGKSTQLDGQRYAVTIAVPKGMRATTCKADLPCTVNRLQTGHTVVTWDKSDGRDIGWEVKFRVTAKR